MSTFQPDETMLHNYLQNKLNPTDEEQLELWLADHPEALENLELDLLMKEGVVELSQEVETENKSFTTPDNKKWYKPMAWAASVSFIMLSAALINNLLLDGTGQTEIYSPVSYELTTMRSSETDVKMISQSSNALIQIPVNVYAEGDYNIEIIHNNQTLKRLNNIQPEFAMVSLIISKQSLELGDYQLVLTNSKSAESINYPFKVID